jgi:hypothetical protein
MDEAIALHPSIRQPVIHSVMPLMQSFSWVVNVMDGIRLVIPSSRDANQRKWGDGGRDNEQK